MRLWWLMPRCRSRRSAPETRSEATERPPSTSAACSASAQATPEFQRALAENPSAAQTLQQATSGGGDLGDTSFLSRLPEVLAHPFKVGFADGIQVVFLMALAVMIIGLVVVFFLPEIPLAARSAQQQRADDAAAAAASDGVPGEVGAGPDAPTAGSDPVPAGGPDRR